MLSIRPLPAFDDNYIWLLTEPPGGDAVVVDPGDEDPVLEALAVAGLRLTAVLVTHHHGDHVGGLDELRQAFPGLPVIGPRDARIRALTQSVGEGDQVQPPGLNTRFRVLEVPGHTASHIAFLADGALFCGDTLFAGGCGRVFDGTFAQLSASLRRIAGLDPTTRCYCAHEYTLANLGFARWVEPENPALRARTQTAETTRAAGLPTVPSSLAEELATNPFLRTGEPGVIAAAERFAGHPLVGHAAVFTALRQWKDTKYD
ncbi:hydroxyacylglutathione hydrolase [uncultured Lamprocystis sp.]|jgi:hydroxyacylglutathione hydrolase|uniref:hydroxyacylglutathione hydrolase n=1 Tax=uncultured Lamprocystis sp. TaxID=543132 RepID=UPI0025D07A8F|nr:hydroxyacylglutathione hydrolase [uncultured Lamprocystis sp.]